MFREEVIFRVKLLSLCWTGRFGTLTVVGPVIISVDRYSLPGSGFETMMIFFPLFLFFRSHLLPFLPKCFHPFLLAFIPFQETFFFLFGHVFYAIFDHLVMFLFEIFMSFVFCHFGNMFPFGFFCRLTFFKGFLFRFSHVLHTFFVDTVNELFSGFPPFPVRHTLPVGKELFSFFCQQLALFLSQFARPVFLIGMEFTAVVMAGASMVLVKTIMARAWPVMPVLVEPKGRVAFVHIRRLLFDLVVMLQSPPLDCGIFRFRGGKSGSCHPKGVV